MRRACILLIALVVLAAGCAGPRKSGRSAASSELRLGYLANLTHAQALIGLQDGTFERSAGVTVIPKVFNAGPAAITALFAGEIDLLYVGPVPALNGYIRSEGKALKVIAGAASGGSVFVVRPGVDPLKLDGTRLATPGIANTQDVALRAWLAGQGLRTREQGGTVRITPMPPAETLHMLRQGEIDGAWVAEPWGTRLVHDAGGQVALDQRDLSPGSQVATTLLVVSSEYLEQNRSTVEGFLAGHAAVTQWIAANPAAARQRLQEALTRLQGKPLPGPVLDEAFARIDFVTDPMVDSVTLQAEQAYSLGFLGARKPDLTGLFDLSLVTEVTQ